MLKRIGLGVAGLLTVVSIALGGLFLLGQSKANERVDLAEESLKVSADSALVARGEYLVAIHACRECHGDRLEGRIFVDAPPFRAVATNLTSGAGGIGDAYTSADWERALRHGVGIDGRGLVPMMPSALYHSLSDNEMAAMIAYLDTIAPVDQVLPPSAFKPLGTIIMGTGALYTADSEIEHDEAHAATNPPHAATVAYGAYRARTLCTYCHGGDLRGGTTPVEPGTRVPPTLENVGRWPLSDFATAMRTGDLPSGYQMNARVMPWTAFQHMDDAEIEALHLYLQTLIPGD